MGAPSDSETDRKPASQESIDDAWGTGSPEHHNQTTHGLFVEPPIARSDVATSISDNDRTTIGTGADRIEPATADPVASVELAISELEESAGSSVVKNTFEIPQQEERKLVQPERSPLEFVMSDEKPNAVPRAARSNDSSRFVLALVGDAPPPTVECDEAPLIPTMQPRLRARLWRKWKWGALAAIGVAGAAVAIKVATSRPAASVATTEALKLAAVPVAAAPAPPAPPAPTPPPSNVAPEPPTQSSAPEPVPTEPEAPAKPTQPAQETAPPSRPAAIASADPTRRAPAKSSTPKLSAKKNTAMATPSAKKPSTARHPAKKPSTAKNVTTAKKSPPAENAWTPKKRSF